MIVYDNIKQKYVIVKSDHTRDYYHSIVYKMYNISLDHSTIDYVKLIQDKLKSLYN